jgi:hypothetical protein
MPFEPKILAESSVSSFPESIPQREGARTRPRNKDPIVREKSGGGGGGTGSLIFKDCDGAETGRLEWVNGVITTSGDQTIEGGCDSSSPPTS